MTTVGDRYDANDAGDYRYSYDGTGRRITKFQDTVNDTTSNAGTSEEYFYNENYQLLEVKLGTTAAGVKTVNNNPKERYLWDLTYIDAPAMVEYDNNLDGVRDQRLWPTFDANYNVTALLTDQGVTVERYAYTPYGERIIINGDQKRANTKSGTSMLRLNYLRAESTSHRRCNQGTYSRATENGLVAGINERRLACGVSLGAVTRKGLDADHNQLGVIFQESNRFRNGSTSWRLCVQR